MYKYYLLSRGFSSILSYTQASKVRGHITFHRSLSHLISIPSNLSISTSLIPHSSLNNNHAQIPPPPLGPHPPLPHPRRQRPHSKQLSLPSNNLVSRLHRLRPLDPRNQRRNLLGALRQGPSVWRKIPQDHA